MAIETLISAVKAWGERTFVAKPAFESFKKSTQEALENAGSDSESTRVVSFKIYGNGNVSWNESFSNVDKLIVDGAPVVFKLDYNISATQTDSAATVSVYKEDTTTPTYTAVFLSPGFRAAYYVSFDAAGGLSFREEVNPFFPISVKGGGFVKELAVAQYDGKKWIGMAAGNIEFVSSSGAKTTLMALEARVAALESTQA